MRRHRLNFRLPLKLLHLLMALAAALTAWGWDKEPSLQAQERISLSAPAQTTDEGAKLEALQPDLERLTSQLDELIRNHPGDPEIPGRLLEAIMAARLADRKDIGAEKEELLHLKYPQSWQAAYLRKAGGWGNLTHAFDQRFRQSETPLERKDMDRLKQILAMMIKEHGIDWNDEKVLFYVALLGVPAKEESKLREALKARKSPAGRAARILMETGLSVKDKIVDLAEIRDEAALRALERYYYAHELKDDAKKSKLVGMALARGYFEQRQPQEAKEVLLQLKSARADSEVEFYLAWAQVEEGQLKAARDTLAAMDEEKSKATDKECARVLIEAIEGHRRAGLSCRADLTRAILELANDIPTSIGARIRIENAEKGPRTLVFHCDTEQDCFCLAILAKDKPILVYKTSSTGTRAVFDDGRETCESTVPGIVPVFQLETRDDTLYAGFKTNNHGSRATESSLEAITSQSWFIPALLADFATSTINSWGWLNLPPESTEDGETLAWLRPTFDKVGLERLKIRFDSKNRIQSISQPGKFHVDVLIFENASFAKEQIEKLWPKVHNTSPTNISPIDHEKFAAVIRDFYGTPTK